MTSRCRRAMVNQQKSLIHAQRNEATYSLSSSVTPWKLSPLSPRKEEEEKMVMVHQPEVCALFQVCKRYISIYAMKKNEYAVVVVLVIDVEIKAMEHLTNRE